MMTRTSLTKGMKIKMEPEMEHAQQENCLLALDCQELKYIAVALRDLENI